MRHSNVKSPEIKYGLTLSTPILEVAQKKGERRIISPLARNSMQRAETYKVE